VTGDACREVVHPDVYKKLLEEIEPGRAHGLRVASGTMRDEPIKQTTNSAIVGGACGHRVPIAGHTSGRQFQPGKDERLKFRVLQILKNRTPSPAPGTSSPPPSPADPCSCADEQCCWRWTLLAVLSDIWAISHIEPGLVDFSHQSDRSTGSNLPASTAGKVVLGRSMRRRSHPTANYPHRRGAGDAAALQEPQEGLPGSRIARRPSCSPGQSRPDASHPKHPPARPPAFTAWRHRCRGRWRPRTRWRAGLSPDPAAAWSDRRGRRRGSCASDRWSSTSGRQTAPVGTAAHRHDKISISRPLVTDVNIGRVLKGEVFRYGRRDFVPVLQAFLQESAVTGAQNSPR